MRLQLLDLLACPTCAGHLRCSSEDTDASGDVLRGSLRCDRCGATYPITNGIPRFVPASNYADSFGYQWNRFRQEQLDSCNGLQQSERRFTTETAWSEDSLRGKWILDAGCGAGRFLEVASRAACNVVGLDISNAVDAARETLKDRHNVHLVQASIFDLPFRSDVFDGVYSIGVLQHTPDPLRATRSLPRVLKPGGALAVTIYERRRWTLLNAKYLFRRVTPHLDHRLLLSAIRGLMPIAFMLTEVLYRLPRLGRVFQFTIPVANYVHDRELSFRQRYQMAILDTFDMLAPAYDLPQSEADVVDVLSAEGIGDLQRLPNAGLNVVGIRRRDAAGPVRQSA